MKSKTVTFSIREEILTSHPGYMVEALWLGRAEVWMEDDFDGSFYAVASLQDLFFLNDSSLPTTSAHRVELPDDSRDGLKFRYTLEQAAISEYLDPRNLPVILPDEFDNPVKVLQINFS